MEDEELAVSGWQLCTSHELSSCRLAGVFGLDEMQSQALSRWTTLNGDTSRFVMWIRTDYVKSMEACKGPV